QCLGVRTREPYLHSENHRHHLLLRIEIYEFSGSAVGGVLQRQADHRVILRSGESAPVEKPAGDGAIKYAENGSSPRVPAPIDIQLLVVRNERIVLKHANVVVDRRNISLKPTTKVNPRRIKIT